jgi:alpha-amylase
LSKLKFLNIGKEADIFDAGLNRDVITRVSENCYLPVNKLLRRLIEKYPGVKVCFSLSGVVIEQLEEYQPQVLASFRDLAQSGSVEFLGETYYHSLSSVTPNNEFIKQVQDHSNLIEHHLGVRPTVFRNTELIYSTSIGAKVAQLGFKGILCDGIERTLDGRSPYQVFKHPVHEPFNILLRSNSLSDDIAFRFGHEMGISADQYAQWIYDVPGDNNVVLLGLDYETFGEHYSSSTGILLFLEKLITKLHNDRKVKLSTPSEVIATTKTKETLDIHDFVSWADQSKDISAWLGNEMQCDAFKTLNGMEEKVMNTHNEDVIKTWRHLQSSDHFYYMSTKTSDDGNVHSYFSHYESPYQAFINYMNVLADFSLRLTTSQPFRQDHTTESERRHSDVPLWAQQYAAHVADTIG